MATMGPVVANMSTSLDGFIEDADGGLDQLFAWLYGKANAAAGDRTVAVASADIAQQCLDLGLLDAVTVDLVPVLLGSGTPFFANLQQRVVLSTPTVVEGNGVTHLTYRVKRA